MKLLIATVALTFSCAISFAQDLIAEAHQAFQDQDWPAAGEAYSALSESAPGNPQYRYRLAVSQRRLGEYNAAVKNYEAARAAGVPSQFVDLELAHLHVAKGDREKALESLEAAAGGGYGNALAIEQDTELAAISDSDGFAELLALVRRNAEPCQYIEEMRQFDFWIGEWEVYDPQGTVKYGENSITKADRGCFLQESWVSSGGTPRSSMNYYDPGQGRWRQHWVGAGGSIIDIYGGIEDGSMVLEGRLYSLNPPSDTPFRGTWTPLDDGRVRQFFEQSTDNGETWVPWFDGYYQRKTE